MIVSNDVLSVRSFTPGQPDSFYRGTRFVRCSMTDELKFNGTVFTGRLFDGAHNPEGNANASGLAEEFDIDGPHGFDDVAPGGSFLKIGVGLLQKPDAKPYDFDRAYPVLDPGVWQVAPLATTGVVYRFSVASPDSRHGVEYTHALLLGEKNGELLIRRTLANTGAEPLRTRHYSHAFFCVGENPVGEGYTVAYPAYPAAPVATTDIPACMKLDINAVHFTAPPDGWVRLGLGGLGVPNRFAINHLPTLAGLQVSTDRPVVDACIFATPKTISPEMFVDITVDPGASETWTTTLRFSTPQ